MQSRFRNFNGRHSPVGIDSTFLDAVWGSVKGYAHIAVGRGATRNNGGKYSHQTFQPMVFLWPQDSCAAMIFMDDVVTQHGRDDLYICPNVLSTQQQGTAVTHRLLHADADSGVDPSKVAALQGFAVASGSGGHAQVYVPVSRDVPLAEYDALQRGMRSYFNGDNKIADNDLLRPVGSFNYKAVVLHELARPYPVEWIVKPFGAPMEPSVIAELLGIGLSNLEDTGAQASSVKFTDASVRGSVEFDDEAFDLELHPDIQQALNRVSGDRSADTYRVIDACFRAGLTLSQIRWAVNQRSDLRERLEGRPDDDVARTFCKLADTVQRNKSEQTDWFERDVVNAVRRLRVREAAKMRFESERQSGAEAFDAGLLQDILQRPAEDPYRISGLLPSNAAMLL